jgi:hypothetical protein
MIKGISSSVKDQSCGSESLENDAIAAIIALNLCVFLAFLVTGIFEERTAYGIVAAS